MKRIYDLNKVQQDVLKDSPKVRITVLVILGLFTLGLLIYNIIKFDVLFFILDLLLLGIFITDLVFNITILEVEKRKYRYKLLTDDDIFEINTYINLIGDNKNNFAKKQYLEKILKMHNEYVEKEKQKSEKPKDESEDFDLEELEKFAKENMSEYFADKEKQEQDQVNAVKENESEQSSDKLSDEKLEQDNIIK